MIAMRSIACAALAAFAAIVPLAAAQAQTVYVSNERGNTISVIDGATAKPIATWPVGERPRGITLSKDGRFVLVCVSNDNAVKVIDRQTGKILREIGAGQDPEQFFLSQDGKTVFVANENDAAVSAIDLASGRVAFQVSVGKEPEGIAQSPDGQWLVVTSEEDNAVSWIDLATHQVVSTMDTEKRPATWNSPQTARNCGSRPKWAAWCRSPIPRPARSPPRSTSRSRACRITRSCPAASASLPMARPPWSPWAGRTASP
jgi:YVTN family beta-propeller protein